MRAGTTPEVAEMSGHSAAIPVPTLGAPTTIVAETVSVAAVATSIAAEVAWVWVSIVVVSKVA